MLDRFFDQPILNSPYEYPALHWELDSSGQPTNEIVERRRLAEFIIPLRGHKTGFKVETGGLQGKQTRFDAPAGDTHKIRTGETAPVAALLEFAALTRRTSDQICAEGRYFEQVPTPEPANKRGAANQTRTHVGTDPGVERRAAIFIGPEFGTVTRPDLVRAAREAGDAGFDVLIACAFNYDARATDFDKLGRIQVLKARMNADLHMADDLKKTGKGNLFVIFGEPDIDILEVDPTADEAPPTAAKSRTTRPSADAPASKRTTRPGTDDSAPEPLIQVRVNGVDVFHPNTGEIRSDGPDGIAWWFIDTDYDEENFFVRQAYFLGAQDPYKALRTTVKAEIKEEAWSSLYSNTSRPFPKPTTGRIAIKVINHLGDEVMKVFRVD